MEPLQNIVLRQETLYEMEEFTQADALHASFGIDANFALGMGVLMFSMLKNNPDLPIVFHIFTDGLHAEDVERIKKIATGRLTTIKIYYMNVDTFKKLPTKFGFPSANYFRFVMADVLCGQVKTLLYLDSDVLCTGSLEELAQVDLKAAFAGTVEDVEDMSEKAQKRSFGFTDAYYFNAGILLINVDVWKKEQVAWQAIDLCLKNHFRQLSQDVLNLLFQGRVYKLDKKYNHLGGKMPPEGTALIHYAGKSKPWHVWGQCDPMTDLYHSYQKETPWRDVPLMQPKTHTHARFMVQYHRRSHNMAQAWRWSVRYLLWKLKAKLRI